MMRLFVQHAHCSLIAAFQTSIIKNSDPLTVRSSRPWIEPMGGSKSQNSVRIWVADLDLNFSALFYISSNVPIHLRLLQTWLKSKYTVS